MVHIWHTFWALLAHRSICDHVLFVFICFDVVYVDGTEINNYIWILPDISFTDDPQVMEKLPLGSISFYSDLEDEPSEACSSSVIRRTFSFFSKVSVTKVQFLRPKAKEVALLRKEIIPRNRSMTKANVMVEVIDDDLELSGVSSLGTWSSVSGICHPQ